MSWPHPSVFRAPLNSFLGFGDHEIDHGTQSLLFRVSLYAAQTEMVDLPVSAAAAPNDGERVAYLVLAIQCARVIGEVLDEQRRLVRDIHPPTAARVAEEGEHTVALSKPAVLVDNLRRWLGRQCAFPVPSQKQSDERRVESHDAHRVVDAWANIADPHLHCRTGMGGADIPPQFAGIFDERHTPVLVHEIVILRPGGRQRGSFGAT